MVDREKVMTGLECLITNSVDCSTCPYAVDGFCPELVAKDAMALLKETHGRWEPLTGMAPPEYHGHKICSVCGSFAPYDPLHMGREILSKYCPGCGARMDGERDD